LKDSDAIASVDPDVSSLSDPKATLVITSPASHLTIPESTAIYSGSAEAATHLSAPTDGPKSESSSATLVSETELPSSEEGFLSFEDWKRMNLLRSSEVTLEGTEPLDIRQAREAPQPRGEHSDQALDSFGDEINLQTFASEHGKTSKERFNYASFDCAAAILKSNPEAKGSSSILDENRDRYMLNKCSAGNKYVIVEMCEDILVDTVVLANFEFFSSAFKDFRVSVTDRYPIQERGWKTLGSFVGNNTRTIQVFSIENPLIWARYVRIEFLSHYGNEFYCPLTLLRIHGTTMMEEYKNQENAKQEEYVLGISNPISSESSAVVTESVDDSSSDATPNPSPTVIEMSSGLSSVTVETMNATMPFPDDRRRDETATNLTAEVPSVRLSTEASLETEIDSVKSKDNITVDFTPTTLERPDDAPTSLPTLSSETIHVENHDGSPITASVATVASEKQNASSGLSSLANPTTQESVYKTITKRLSLLEANATLSLRYIEEQSQLLRDVFGKMERRHGSKIDSFLSEMNTTLAARLEIFVLSKSRSVLIP
jgi:hypothetical protein